MAARKGGPIFLKGVAAGRVPMPLGWLNTHVHFKEDSAILKKSGRRRKKRRRKGRERKY